MDALLSGFTTVNNIKLTTAFVAHPYSQEDIFRPYKVINSVYKF